MKSGLPFFSGVGKIKNALLCAVMLAGIVAFIQIARASVLYSYTLSDQNIGQASNGTANLYNGFIFYVDGTSRIDSFTLKTPLAQSNSSPNSITYKLVNAAGTTLDTKTDLDRVTASNTEYTISLTAPQTLSTGYYFYGSHYNSGTGVVKGRTVDTTKAIGCGKSNFNVTSGTIVDYTTSCGGTERIYFKANGDLVSTITFTQPVASQELTDFSNWYLTYGYATTTPLGGGTGDSRITVYYSTTSSSTATYTDSATTYQTVSDVQSATVPKSRALIQIPEVNGKDWWVWGKLFDFYGNVAASSTPFQFSVDIPGDITFTSASTTAELATTCDSADGAFANSICKLLQAVFYPSQQSIDNFSDLKDALENKPPFGYISSFNDAMGDLSSGASSTLDLSDLSGIGIFDDFRDLLEWVLWFLFGFWVYNKFRHMKF